MWHGLDIISGIMLVNLFTASIVSMAADTQNSEAESQELLRDMSQVRTLCENKDLEGLEKLATELERKWFTKSKERYGHMMLEICCNFRSWDFKDEEQLELEKIYARLALERSYKLQENDKIPIEVEFKLLRHIQQSVQYLKDAVKSEDWPNRRSTMAKLYFHTWHRLEKTIDAKWDPNETLLSWPRPSGGVRIWFSGMSPKAIKDPKVRAEYKAALEEFWHKVEWYNEQRRLRTMKKRFLPKLQKHLLQLYSGPLFDSKKLETVALQKDLEKYVDDKYTRESILSSVKRRLLEETEQKQKK